MTDITINTYEREGVFVLIVEGKGQAPIVMEAEGQQTSYDAAMDRLGKISWAHRYCLCRLVPVAGNDLVLLDAQRMQP